MKTGRPVGQGESWGGGGGMLFTGRAEGPMIDGCPRGVVCHHTL